MKSGARKLAKTVKDYFTNDRSESHVCPRVRDETGFDPQAHWKRGHGMVGQEEKACSGCGSLHPERFLELVAHGYMVGPTDKNYKAYLHAPDDGDDAGRREKLLSMPVYRRVHQKIKEQQGKRAAEYYLDGLRSPTPTVGKFYFQHLNKDQQHDFIDLINDGTMTFSYPGNFYVLPYFVRRA